MSVNKFYPINVQNANNITGTYGSVSLLVNANEETKGTSVLKQVSINQNIDASYSLAVSGDTSIIGRTDLSGSLFLNGVEITAVGSQDLSGVLQIGNVASTFIDMNGYDISGCDKLNVNTINNPVKINGNLDMSNNQIKNCLGISNDSDTYLYSLNGNVILEALNGGIVLDGNITQEILNINGNIIQTGGDLYTDNLILNLNGDISSLNNLNFDSISTGNINDANSINFKNTGGSLLNTNGNILIDASYVSIKGVNGIDISGNTQLYGVVDVSGTFTANSISVGTDLSANGSIYGNQFIYDGFIRLNDLVNVNTSLGTITPTFPIAQIFNIAGTGTLNIDLPDLTLLPTGVGKGSVVYFLRGSSTSTVNINAYSGQDIKLIDGSTVSTFVFNSPNSNMVQFIFSRINPTTYRWVQVTPIDQAGLYIENTYTQKQTIQDDLFVDGGTLQLNSGTTDLISRINYKDPTYDFNFLSQNASKLSISLGSATPDVDSKFYTISIGTDSNKDLTTGTANVGVGVGAIRYNTIGSNNVGVGYDSLHEIINGDYNTAIGFKAGTNAYGTGYDTSYCTFLGAETRAFTNITNSTAIGYNTVVKKSNTIQLGSNSETVNISGDLEVYNINLTNINGSPYSGGGGGSQSLSQVLAIGNTASPYSIVADAGLRSTYIALAITGTTTLTSTSFGSITYLASSTGSNTINLPAVVNGAVLNINNQSSHYHTIASSSAIMGSFGSQITTQIINRGQAYIFIGVSSQWHCVQVYGVMYQYIRTHSTTQTISARTYALFDTAGGNFDDNTQTWATDTWNGKKLDYNNGVFTNNTGQTMTLFITSRIIGPNNNIKWCGIVLTSNRYNTVSPLLIPFYWQVIGSATISGTSLVQITGSYTFANGEGFGIFISTPNWPITYGSTTIGVRNFINITRLG